ncbi:TPA: helix-turn-helix domain-containing protein [Burkholderia vietnamiensis]|uniref:helix-turn-helix domain-containing protein n=1 Tax=Burkholderia vietnamiensis TaxID=60552 RepID=UPI00158A3E8C|nr:helix-turn-helix domain-containing protein [Burkholderia vietnamiensis]HDR9161701.1 helix-turn-helix domain-containing protein [Burkholderia vietnamiensis]
MQKKVITAAITAQLVMTETEYDEFGGNLSEFAEKHKLNQPKLSKRTTQAMETDMETGEQIEVTDITPVVTYVIRLNLTSIEQYNVLRDLGIDKQNKRANKKDDSVKQEALRLMREGNMTRDQIAAQVGASKSTLQNWSKAEREVA